MAMTSSQVTEVDTARLASAAGTLKEKIQKAETSFQNVMPFYAPVSATAGIMLSV
jgi:hypothetical protein